MTLRELYEEEVRRYPGKHLGIDIDRTEKLIALGLAVEEQQEVRRQIDVCTYFEYVERNLAYHRERTDQAYRKALAALKERT